MTNTCTLDNFLFILYCWYHRKVSDVDSVLRPKEVDVGNAMLLKIHNIVKMLLSKKFFNAKLSWLLNITYMKPVGCVLNAESLDCEVILNSIKSMFTCEYRYICSSSTCPSNAIMGEKHQQIRICHYPCLP